MLIEKNKKFFYHPQYIVKCPYCNIIIFYIYDYWEHNCLKTNQKYIINENNIEKFLFDITKLDNKSVNTCNKHNKIFAYYKNSNYYCDECLNENNLNDFIILDEIKLQENEINDFKNLIEIFNNILLEVKKINENLILKTEKN